MVKSFIIEPRQEVFVEEDSTKDCAVYPTAEYRSYQDCDTAFVLQQLVPIVPIWGAENLRNVTAVTKTNITYYVRRIVELGVGLMSSSCRLPCTLTRTVTKLTGTRPSHYNVTSILMTFTDNMQITKTDFVQFHLSSFLSDTGGSLGLWLGLGVLQLGEILLQWVTVVWGRVGWR